MKKLVRALKAGARGYAEAIHGPSRFLASGIQVRCPHCKGDLFKEFSGVADTTLWCENCGLSQRFMKQLDRMKFEA